MPERMETYWEPFIGGGAVFFTLADRIGQATLSDINEELIITYSAVKRDVDGLIDALSEHATKHGKHEDYYNEVRGQVPSDSLAIAARFIYLNKTCYNGLYRVNKSGKFNVPKGRYKNPTICDEGRLRAASEVLKKAKIKLGDFSKVVKPSAGDFIYCDPPYDDCFADYQAGGFSVHDQERLRNSVNLWNSRGAKSLISNSDTDLIRRLYKTGFITHSIAAPRHINSKASGRTPAAEVIIKSG